jgi:two-component system response regulator AtoC
MRRVLVVDDEENLRLVVRTLPAPQWLRGRGRRERRRGAGLVEILRAGRRPHDVRMPKMGGLDLLATLKAKGSEPPSS